MNTVKMMTTNRRQFLKITAAGLLLAACSPKAQVPAPAAPAAAAPAATIPEVTIEFNGKDFKVPANMPGGIVSITINNTADKPKAIGISRLRAGKTSAQVYQLMKEHPEDYAGVFALISSVASLDPVAPGKPEHLIADLKTGDFILDATDHYDDQPPPDAPRVYGEFSAKEVVGTLEPTAQVNLDLTDFALVGVDQLGAGKLLWKVHNVGKQWHMFLIAKPNDGVSPEDVVKAASSDGPPSGPPPFEFVGGVAPISEDERQWVEIDLKPGPYVLLCPLPDMAAKDGPPMSHAAHGMHKIITVK